MSRTEAPARSHPQEEDGLAAPPVWLTRDEAAAYVGCEKRTLDRYIADGTLVAYKLGPRAIRIKRSDLDAIMQPVGSARTSDVDPITTAMSIVQELFAKHGITDPSQAKRLIRERFTQTELERYKAARRVLDGLGAIG